jgi:hypothetical protein
MGTTCLSNSQLEEVQNSGFFKLSSSFYDSLQEHWIVLELANALFYT